jgi:hypothetical protein
LDESHCVLCTYAGCCVALQLVLATPPLLLLSWPVLLVQEGLL